MNNSQDINVASLTISGNDKKTVNVVGELVGEMILRFSSLHLWQAAAGKM